MSLKKCIKYYKLLFLFRLYGIATLVADYCNDKTEPLYRDDELCTRFEKHYNLIQKDL